MARPTGLDEQLAARLRELVGVQKKRVPEVLAALRADGVKLSRTTLRSYLNKLGLSTWIWVRTNELERQVRAASELRGGNCGKSVYGTLRAANHGKLFAGEKRIKKALAKVDPRGRDKRKQQFNKGRRRVIPRAPYFGPYAGWSVGIDQASEPRISLAFSEGGRF